MNLEMRFEEIPQSDRDQIEMFSQKMWVAHKELAAAKESLREFLESYECKRRALFLDELDRAGLIWCGHCQKMVSIGGFAILKTWGRECRVHGYGDAYYSFEEFKRCLQVCRGCRISLLARHATFGKTRSGGQTSFFAKEILPEQACSEGLEIKKLPEILPPEAENKFKIPPRIICGGRDLHVGDLRTLPFMGLPIDLR